MKVTRYIFFFKFYFDMSSHFPYRSIHSIHSTGAILAQTVCGGEITKISLTSANCWPSLREDREWRFSILGWITPHRDREDGITFSSCKLLIIITLATRQRLQLLLVSCIIDTIIHGLELTSSPVAPPIVILTMICSVCYTNAAHL